jgi:eukaryotic-like serine/threonine-protein kinase
VEDRRDKKPLRDEELPGPSDDGTDEFHVEQNTPEDRKTRVDHEVESRAAGMLYAMHETHPAKRRSGRPRASKQPRTLKRASRYADRYELLGLLGVGGMGSVYRVRDRMLEDDVALKILRKDQAESKLAVARFHREVKFARRVNHPNVVRIFDAGQFEGEYYYTMECITGDVMSAIMAAGTGMEVEKALNIGVQIASGLGGAHKAGVLHRDLKPENVMVAGDGRVVVTDFGVAIALNEPGAVLLPMQGAGTPLYMSPEQIEGGKLDERTDLYALGLILFEMLVGRLPWERSEALESQMARLAVPAPDVREFAPDVPEAVGKLVATLLAREPAERPADAWSVVQVLESCLHDARVSAHPQPAASQIESPAPALARAIATTGTPHVRAVAVLPVRNLGDESDGYLAEGLTEDLIDKMIRCPGLRVASRFSLRLEDGGDVLEMGRRAGVDAVIECSLQKRANQALRVRAHIVEMERGFVLWSEKFECTAAELPDLQERIANALARTIAIEMGRGQGGAVPEKRENVDLFLRAKKAYGSWTGAGAEQAIAQLDEALVVSPQDPALRAHKALAQLRLWSLDPRAPVSLPSSALAAARAVLLELPYFGEAHLAVGTHAMLDGNWAFAARRMEEAVRCNPALSDAHTCLGMLHCWTGDVGQGMRMFDVAVRLDPWNLSAIWEMAFTQALLGEVDDAYTYLDRADFAFQNHPVTVSARLRIASWFGDDKELTRAREDAGDVSKDRHSVEPALIRLHVGEDPVRQMGVLAALAAQSGAPAMMRGRILQVASEKMITEGDPTEALTALKTVARWSVDTLWFERCPALAPLRSSQEFDALCQQVADLASQVFPFRSA